MIGFGTGQISTVHSVKFACDMLSGDYYFFIFIYQTNLQMQPLLAFLPSMVRQNKCEI